MGVPVGNLSGGQRQAMALLMSTMTPIEFLILDEHTAALDPKTAEIIMELTGRIVREKQLTTIMVTHNLRYAVEYGDRLLMMHQGRWTFPAKRGGTSRSRIFWKNSTRSASNVETDSESRTARICARKKYGSSHARIFDKRVCVSTAHTPLFSQKQIIVLHPVSKCSQHHRLNKSLCVPVRARVNTSTSASTR